MSNCKEIKRLIEECDRPDALAFEALNHMSICRDCELFATERARLRELLSASTRVSVPLNFDAVLAARLRERTSRRAFAWSSGLSSFRLGTAAAGLVIAVFVAQYAGLFSPAGSPAVATQPPVEMAAGAATKPALGQPAPAPIPDTNSGEQSSREKIGLNPARIAQGGTRRSGAQRAATVLSDRRVVADESRMLLLRGQDREIEVPVMTVSIGMQQQVLNSSGRLVARNVGASF